MFRTTFINLFVLDQNNFDESASTSHLTDDKSIPIEADAQDEEDIETDGVSSGQDGMQVCRI